MGDWNLLGSILEEVHIHSTIVGKIWLTILFIFRMLVLGVAAEDVWDDEQSEFICNTEQPGCSNICYDKAFPISLIRYWVLQIIFVSSPSLVYMGHALYRLRALEKERQKRRARLRAQLEDLEPMPEEHRRVERELRKLEEQKKVHKAPLRGSLLRTYVLHILTRSVVEVGFMIGQYLLYGFHMSPLYKCTRPPCPNTVDCFVSRPTEKTVFMVFMNSIAAVSLFLNILEIAHLGLKKIQKSLYGRPRRPPGPAEEDTSLYNSKKSSVVPPACPAAAAAAAPPPPPPHGPAPPAAAPAPAPAPAPAGPPGRQHRGELRGAPPPRRRHSAAQHHGQHPPPPPLPSSSSEEAPRAAAAAAAVGPRRAPRKHSRVSLRRDLDEERGDSPDSGHCPGTRKSSFLSRVLAGSRAGSGSESPASRGGPGPGSGSGSGSGLGSGPGSGSGSGPEGKRREEDSPPGSPPPAAAMGRRVSMASRVPGWPAGGGRRGGGPGGVLPCPGPGEEGAGRLRAAGRPGQGCRHSPNAWHPPARRRAPARPVSFCGESRNHPWEAAARRGSLRQRHPTSASLYPLHHPSCLARDCPRGSLFRSGLLETVRRRRLECVDFSGSTSLGCGGFLPEATTESSNCSMNQSEDLHIKHQIIATPEPTLTELRFQQQFLFLGHTL
uniref:Gap junction protein n=1 Tax=Accipiter nisus TaxID=211598 RepID=A0A8B9M5J6_9AVES